MRAADAIVWTTFALAALLLGRALTLGQAPLTVLAPQLALAGCEAGEPSTSILTASGPAVALVDRSASLTTNGFVRLRACTSGTLTFRAKGSSARGHGALATATWRDQNLWQGEVTDELRVEVAVPGDGWIVIAFHNDAGDDTGDRNLWLSEIAFVR